MEHHGSIAFSSRPDSLAGQLPLPLSCIQLKPKPIERSKGNTLPRNSRNLTGLTSPSLLPLNSNSYRKEQTHPTKTAAALNPESEYQSNALSREEWRGVKSRILLHQTKLKPWTGSSLPPTAVTLPSSHRAYLSYSNPSDSSRSGLQLDGQTALINLRLGGAPTATPSKGRPSASPLQYMPYEDQPPPQQHTIGIAANLPPISSSKPPARKRHSYSQSNLKKTVDRLRRIESIESSLRNRSEFTRNTLEDVMIQKYARLQEQGERMT